MSIIITCGNVRCEFPLADLCITLPQGYKGNVNIQEVPSVKDVIPIKEEVEVVEVESVIPPVTAVVVEPLRQSLRIRTPPLPVSPPSFRSPVVAYGLSPSPIPYCCPENSPHEIPEPFFLDSYDSSPIAPELQPLSLVEMAQECEYLVTESNPKKPFRVNKKTDRNIGNYISEGTLITHTITGGFTCVSMYHKEVSEKTHEIYDCFVIEECNAVPSFIGMSLTSLSGVCNTFAELLVHATEGNATKYNGWVHSSVLRNGKFIKLSKIRDEMTV